MFFSNKVFFSESVSKFLDPQTKLKYKTTPPIESPLHFEKKNVCSVLIKRDFAFYDQISECCHTMPPRPPGVSLFGPVRTTSNRAATKPEII